MTSRLGVRAGGFSLLELLVAMAILAMSLALLYRVDASAVRGVSDLAGHERAGLLAQSLLDSHEAIPAGGLHESGQTAGFDWSLWAAPRPLPPGLDAGAVVLHDVRVAVTWQGATGTRQLELATLLPQARPKPGEAVR